MKKYKKDLFYYLNYDSIKYILNDFTQGGIFYEVYYDRKKC